MRDSILLAKKRLHRGYALDEELVFIASILHDLGLVDAYMTDNERFEADGADAAVAFLKQ